MENEDGQKMEYRKVIKDDDAEWEKVAGKENIGDNHFNTPDQFMSPVDAQPYDDLDDPNRSEQNKAYQIKVVEEDTAFGDNNQSIYVGNSSYTPADR